MSSVQSKKSASAQNRNVNTNGNAQSQKGKQTMKAKAQNLTVNGNTTTQNTKGTSTMSSKPRVKNANAQNPGAKQTVSRQPQNLTTQGNSTPTTGTPATAPLTPPPNVNWPQYVATATAAFQAAVTGLGVTGAPSGQMKQQVAKPRKGFQELVPQVANLLTQYNLVTPAVPIDTMTEDLANVQTLTPLYALVQNYAKALEGVIFENQTESWSIMLDAYHSLKRVAKTNGALAAALQPVTEFFAYRQSAVKATKPTKPAAKTDAKLKKVASTVAARGARGAKAAQAASAALAQMTQTVSSSPASPPAAAPANGASQPAAPAVSASNGAASAHA